MEVSPMDHDVLDASALLAKAGVSVGMTVADCGAGVDAPFAIAAAQMVGPMGTVYALDVVKTALEQIRQKALRKNLHNIEPVWTDLEIYGAAKQLHNNSVDVAVLSNTLFQSRDHAGILTEISRFLKQGGALLILDWKPDSHGIGPANEQCVDPAHVKMVARVAHLEAQEEFSAGQYHWGMILKKV